MSAQEVRTSANYGNTIKEGIVREWAARYPSTISYIVAEEKHYFVYADASMQLLNMEIDSCFDVHDFVVGRNYVFFCGQDRVKLKGVFGWFRANAGNWGGSSYYVYEDFRMQPYPFSFVNISSLDAMVLIEERDSVRLALVGEDENGMACILRIAGEMPLSPTGWDYALGVSPNPTETLEKICMTDDYIATGGTIYFNGYFSMRFFDPANMFASGGIQNTVYTYTSNNGFPACDQTFPIQFSAGHRFSEKHHHYPLELYSEPFQCDILEPLASKTLNETDCAITNE